MLSCTTTRISDGAKRQITTNLFLIEQRDFLKTFSLGGAQAKLPPGRGEGRNLERGRDCSAATGEDSASERPQYLGSRCVCYRMPENRSSSGHRPTLASRSSRNNKFHRPR